MSGQWEGGKGSKPRPVADQKKFDDNWDKIFGKKDDNEYESDNPIERPFNFKDRQQDLTELNSDGNRERGRYGEDLLSDKSE